jgi:RNA polymerase sigma factor (sigma-70 family)
LIHEFLLAAWDGLVLRYEPEQAEFKTYLYGAFLRFARHQLARLRRQSAVLEELDSLLEVQADLDGHEQRVLQLDLPELRVALGKLPQRTQRLLAIYFDGGSKSERAVARELGVSRYRLRLDVTEAVAFLSAELGEMPPGITREEWEVARKVLHFGYSAEEVASKTGKGEHEVRRSVSRALRGIGRGLWSTRIKPVRSIV